MQPTRNTDHFAQVRSIFDRAIECDPRDRVPFLDRVCGDNPDLRREVEVLLNALDDHGDDVGGFLERLPLAPYSPLETSPEEGEGGPDPLIGSSVAHYQILEKLGGGGMGVVYKARDSRLKRLVALKFLPPHLSADDEAKARLFHEARAASALDHTNVGVIHEISETEAGQLFISMAYYDGETLKEKIAGGPLTVAEALDYTMQIAKGLSRAHEAGIMHRDVKPANIIVTTRGTVKLVDFGLAKVEDVSELTRQGVTPGTIAYMSPEQTRGDDVDVRTDVWSLGVVAYEMLTGERPFRGDNSDTIIYGIRNDEPQPLTLRVPNAPKVLADAIERMLQKDRNARFASAAEVLSALKTGQIPPRIAGVARRKDPVSIVLLPLVGKTRGAEQEWFTDGMTDALITDLARIGGLRIISRASAMLYRDTDKTPPQIADELGVDYVVEGSVAKQDGDVQISARLIDAHQDRYLWADVYERPFASTLSLQSEIARAIASQIKVELTPEEQERMAVARAVDPDTHEMYLKGMYHLNKFTPEGIQKGLQYLHRAVEKTPDEPLAHAGLALAYNLISHMPAPPPHAVPKARAATERALELDPNLAEAQLSLAMISIYTDWDRPLARRAYERALELNPSLAMAHAHYCWCLTADGEVEKGLSELHQAQKLDPLHPMYPGWLGESYYVLGDFERAIEESKKALELNPDLPIGLFSLGSAYARKGMFEDAIEIHKRVAELSPSYRFALGETYALAGRPDEARKIVADLESQPSVWDSWGIALIYQALGERDNVFHWLEVAYRQRHPYMQWFRNPRCFRDLSDDPRYDELAKRLNLPNS